MNPKHIPNVITAVRIVLVWPVIALILEGNFAWALLLFAVAGISDGVDGFLAKHYHWQSRLGSYLDPLADKLLLISTFISAAWLGMLPAWLVATVILRDLAIISGAIAYYFLLRPFEGQPHWSSKLNTLMQLVLIVTVLAQQLWESVWSSLVQWLIPVVFVTTAGSGFWYVWEWSRRYRQERSSNS
jgi:cardiolipin synthase